METVLPLLGFVDGQEQDPWQPIRLWLDLKHHRVIVHNHPSKCFTPPSAERYRLLLATTTCSHSRLIARP